MINDIRPMGDRALLLAAKHPAGVAATVTDLNFPGVIEAVPAAETVLVSFDSTCDRTRLQRAISEFDDIAAASKTNAHIVIPVTYDGVDLRDVAELNNLTIAEVIQIHSSATYTVAFCGFAPGFAYLQGLDDRLVTPRLSTPRPRVPAGAVAIADKWSAVYPRESPGGWRLLGHTTTQLFDLNAERPALLAPGDTVGFTVAAPTESQR